MDEGKNSENIFFTEVVFWKLPFQEGIFTCVTKRKNIFLMKTSFNLSSFISWVTLGKTIKNQNFCFWCVSDFFFPLRRKLSLHWVKLDERNIFRIYFFFFSGEFLHCVKLSGTKSSQFEKFRNKREKNVFLQNIFFLNLWNWSHEWNQSEKCFISCLKQKENIFSMYDNFFFPVFLLSTYLMELFE